MRRPMSIFKVRTLISAAAFFMWGLNLWFYSPLQKSSYTYMMQITSPHMWAIIFFLIAGALAWGAYRSNGIKGRFANRANGIATAVAAVWAFGCFFAWRAGYSVAGLAGCVSWTFVALQMFVTSRSPTTNPFDGIRIEREESE